MTSSGPDPTPTERLYAIVEQGLCIGCGMCEALAPDSITVRKTTTGFEVPVVTGELDQATVDLVYDVCPGTRIEGLPDRLVEPDTAIDPVWGPYRRIVRAWAGNPEVRHIGSTGGVLTALAQYLLASGRVEFVLHRQYALLVEVGLCFRIESGPEAEQIAGQDCRDAHAARILIGSLDNGVTLGVASKYPNLRAFQTGEHQRIMR